MALIQLVYVSRRSPTLGADELKEIVAQSTRRNYARGITGVLLCCGEHLMQLLEGEEAAVDALFERIRNDDRHQDVQLLLHKPVNKRLFPDSRMTLAQLNRRFRLDRGRLIRLVDYIRTSEETSRHTAETRMLLSDFHQQLSA